MVLKHKIESERDEFRHGDVMLVRVDPEEMKRINPDTFFKPLETKTLQYGELTGHHHTLKNKQGVQVLVETTNPQQQYLKVEKGQVAELTHQEHHTIEIPEGIYVQIQERRFDPFSGMIVNAKD